MKPTILLIVCCITGVQSSSHENPGEEPVAEVKKMVRRIVGGKEVSIEDRPYLVSIQLHSEHICGGSIISPNFVLTTSHCLSEEPQHYSVRSGSTYHDSGGTLHEVYRLIKHKTAEIGLMEIVPPFKFDNVTCLPIEMFRLGEKSEHGTWAVVSGWGVTIENGTCIPDKLRSVSVPIVDKKVCAGAYKEYCQVKDDQICAGLLGKGGKDSCQKDSGGPLTINGRLAGIVVRGLGCGRPDFPGIYTEVAFHKKWINKQIWLVRIGNGPKQNPFTNPFKLQS